jgi:hypothetical protein
VLTIFQLIPVFAVQYHLGDGNFRDGPEDGEAMPGCPACRNFSQYSTKERAMRLTFIGKDPLSNPTGSPTVYVTNAATLVVQGWVIADGEAREGMKIPPGEDAVEIPIRMLPDILRGFLQIAGTAIGGDTISRSKEQRDTEFRDAA